MASSANERDVDVNFPLEDDLEHLLEDYSHFAPPSEGELLQGHVVKIVMRGLGDGEGDLERDRVAIRWEGEPGDSRELT